MGEVGEVEGEKVSAGETRLRVRGFRCLNEPYGMRVDAGAVDGSDVGFGSEGLRGECRRNCGGDMKL